MLARLMGLEVVSPAGLRDLLQSDAVTETITQQLCADASSDATTPAEGRYAELLASTRAASFENDRGRFRKLFEHTHGSSNPYMLTLSSFFRRLFTRGTATTI